MRAFSLTCVVNSVTRARERGRGHTHVVGCGLRGESIPAHFQLLQRFCRCEWHPGGTAERVELAQVFVDGGQSLLRCSG